MAAVSSSSGGRLKLLLIFLSRVGCLALAAAALFVLDTADTDSRHSRTAPHVAYRSLRWALRSQVMPWGWIVLCFHGRPANVLLAPVIAVEWVLMHHRRLRLRRSRRTHDGMKRHDCGATAVCARYLAAAAVACAAGPLATVSALGMLWVLIGSPFRRAQD